MEITKETTPITLLTDSLDMGLLRLLLTRYMVVVTEQRDGKVIYELNKYNDADS